MQVVLAVDVGAPEAIPQLRMLVGWGVLKKLLQEGSLAADVVVAHGQALPDAGRDGRRSVGRHVPVGLALLPGEEDADSEAAPEFVVRFSGLAEAVPGIEVLPLGPAAPALQCPGFTETSPQGPACESFRCDFLRLQLDFEKLPAHPGLVAFDRVPGRRKHCGPAQQGKAQHVSRQHHGSHHLPWSSCKGGERRQ